MSQKKDSKTNKWYYYGAYIDKDGIKHQYKKRGFDTQRLARKAEDAFRDDIDSCRIIKNNKTFSQITGEYTIWAKKRMKVSSFISEQQSLGNIINALGKLKINKINSIFLQDYVDELDLQYSKKYVERLFYTINKIFNYAVDHNYVTINPMKKVKRSPRKNEMIKEMLFWEPMQFNLFINNVDDEIYSLLFTLLYYMGVRRGEAMALKWSDINFFDNTITINKTITYKTNPYSVTPPKTKNSIRTITMPSLLAFKLKAYKKKQSNIYEFNEDRYVFGFHRPIPPENIRRRFKKYIALTNIDGDGNKKETSKLIPEIRLHDLRHSHASYLINNMSAGFTDFDIAKRLGDTVATLHDTYAHWFKSADKGIIDFMDKDIGK